MYRDDEIEALLPVLRRVVAARVPDQHLVDDVVQDALAKLLATKRPLTTEGRVAYAVVTARNTAINHQRAAGRRHRLEMRLAASSPPLPSSTEGAVLDAEEREALSQALERLPDAERQLILAHEIDDVRLGSLAAEAATSGGAMAVRLANIRAKLRVDYLLAVRRVKLPSTRCRPVLLALSAGDRRRQRQTRSSNHLLECSICASLANAVVQRSRPLLVAVPLSAAQRAAAWLRSRGKAHPAQVGGTGVAVVAGAVLVVMALNAGGSHGIAQLTTRSGVDVLASLMPDNRPTTQVRLARLVGQPVHGRSLVISSLAGNPSPGEGLDDERFWIGARGRRILVFLHAMREPPFILRPGMNVTFSGTLLALSGSPSKLDLTPTAALATTRIGYYIEVTDLASVRTN